MTTLGLRGAFFHVIDSHRWLAASGCVWNLVGPSAQGETKQKAHKLLQNVDVLARDTLLLHSRSLIDFYTKTPQPGSTDIFLRDFGVSVNSKIHQQLEQYKKPIEVHLLHLTDWRDPAHRNLHATGQQGNRQRTDWDSQASLIVESILDALKYVSEQSSSWQIPFKDLYDASTGRFRDNSYGWPANLGEWEDVEKYLASCGL
ncbi:MAG: hypothetical protein ACHP8A_20315 [Terriglobales bacterium]